MQSGSCLDSWPAGLFLPGMGAGVPFASRATVERNGSAFAAMLGCPLSQAVACLRGKDPLALLGATRAFTTPAYDTALLPDAPAAAVRAGKAARVPVLSGTNLDEHRAFTGVQELWLGAPLTAADYAAMLDSAFGDRAADVAARYPAGSYETPGLAWATLATDRIWACPSLATRRLLARHAPTFGYEFAERHGPAVSDTYPWGAAHGYELPYLFDVAGFITVGDVQADLADDMIDAWSRFAGTGRPGWASLPAHRAFAADRTAGVDLAAEHQCSFWSDI